MKTRLSSKRAAEAKPEAAKAAKTATKDIPIPVIAKPRLDIPGLTAGSYGMQPDSDDASFRALSERYATARDGPPPLPTIHPHLSSPTTPKSPPTGNVFGGSLHPASGAAAFPFPSNGLLPSGPPPPYMFSNFYSSQQDVNIPPPPPPARFMTWDERRSMAAERSSGNLVKQIFSAPPPASTTAQRAMNWEERRSIAEALRNKQTHSQAQALLKEHRDQWRYMHYQWTFPPVPALHESSPFPSSKRKGKKATPKKSKPASLPPLIKKSGSVENQPKKDTSVPHVPPKGNGDPGEPSTSAVARPQPPEGKGDFSPLDILTQAVESVTRAKRIYIDQPSKWDILAGSLSIDHKGNKRFNNIVAYTIPKYHDAVGDEQAQMVKDVVQGIELYGGRFVKYDNDEKKYYLMTKDEAIELTQKLLDSKYCI